MGNAVSYITGSRQQLRDLREAIARQYCFLLGIRYPIEPDTYGPGRQPDPREAYYQTRYSEIRDAGRVGGRDLPDRIEIDQRIEGLDGATVILSGGRVYEIDLSGRVDIAAGGVARVA